MPLNISLIKYNQIVMMAIRGFTVPPHEIAYAQAVESGQPIQSIPPLSQNYQKPGDSSMVVVIFVPLRRKDPDVPGKVVKADLEASLGPAQIQFGSTLQHIILVSEEFYATADTELLSMIESMTLRIERFSYEQMSIRPDIHNHQPPHRLLTIVERDQIRAEGRTKLSNFPKIPLDNPLAKWYGAIRGDMFVFFKTSPLTGDKIPYYRVVS